MSGRCDNDPIPALRPVPRESVDEVRRRHATAPRTCRICGCTDNSACPCGCSWVAIDLCSSCRLDRDERLLIAMAMESGGRGVESRDRFLCESLEERSFIERAPSGPADRYFLTPRGRAAFAGRWPAQERRS